MIETSAAGGSDTVRSSVSYRLGDHVDHLVLLGSAWSGTGNASFNRIVGNAADNRLDGAGGADFMQGGAGNDTYYVGNLGERIVETSGGGNDVVVSSVNCILANNVERLILTGTARLGAGNALANSITGNAEANVLNGGAGADSLAGGGGNDTYYVDHRLDRAMEAPGAGYDTVRASVSFRLGYNSEQLILSGSAANGVGNNGVNRIVGTGSNNTLNGLGGSDHLLGGAGADLFLFNTRIGADVDRLLDFSVADDTIMLDRSIFSKIASTGRLAASAFHQGISAADADDRIIYDKATGNIWYDGDGSGAGQAILFAKVGAGLDLTNLDFHVVA